MSNPITIVIPAYNRAHTLSRTLASIEKQNVAPAKVVLVDNSSSDSTLSLMRDWAAKPHPFEVTVVAEQKRGACAARNRGLQEVTTEFVMFFDSDDVMLPDHVSDFSAAVSRNPQADIYGRDIIAESIGGKRKRLYFTSSNTIFNHIFRGCLSTQRIVVRTELVRGVGGWDEDLSVWNDFELGVRLLLATDRLVKLPGTPTVITYQQAESITGTSFSAKAGQWEMSLDKIETLVNAADRTDLVKWIDCRRMVLAAEYEKEGRKDLAESLRVRTAVRRRAPKRLLIIYNHQRSFHRLSWIVAKLIFLF